uniref:Uncharacterized protein n=1 Tax=Anguilla anguilla TaxID=7936 RepID=A0A0E9VAB6_ANGAN
MLPLGEIISKHSTFYHFYADETQLYLSAQPNEFIQIDHFA